MYPRSQRLSVVVSTVYIGVAHVTFAFPNTFHLQNYAYLDFDPARNIYLSAFVIIYTYICMLNKYAYVFY